LSFYRGTLGLTVAADLGGFVELNANGHCLLSPCVRVGMRESVPGILISPVAGQHAALIFAMEELDTCCADLRAYGVAFAGADHPEWAGDGVSA
jgi:hypothetical protein